MFPAIGSFFGKMFGAEAVKLGEEKAKDALVSTLKDQVFPMVRDELLPLVKEAARQEAQYLVQQQIDKLNGGLPK